MGLRKNIDKKVFLIIALVILLAGCAPMPMQFETDGPVVFDGIQFEPGRILVLPATANLNSCIPDAETCLEFQRKLVGKINTIGLDQAFTTSDGERYGKGITVVENGIAVAKSMDAKYLLLWTPGPSEDRAPFSFGADKFVISSVRVIDILNSETVWNLAKGYSLSGSNTESMNILAGKVGEEIASQIARR
ncbi:hypothetical protein ACFL3I_00440 [Pseudomonadota bacterium]